MSRFMEADDNGTIQNFLTVALNIVELKVTTDPITERGFIDLENLLGSHSWRFLRSLRLKGIGVLHNHIIDLILRHKYSLVLVEVWVLVLTTK